MALLELEKVVQPPSHPLDVGDKNRWREIQKRLGILLPDDLCSLAMRYGSGYFEQPQRFRLQIWNPFKANYKKMVQMRCEFLRKIRGLVARRDVPYGIFPDHPGWFPFGEVEDSWLCWVTEGEPDNWPILLVGNRGGYNLQQLSMPLTSFLTELFCGQLQIFLWQNRGSPLYFFGPETILFVPAEQFVPPAKSLLGYSLPEQKEPGKIDWFGPDQFGRPLGVQAVLGPWNVFHPGGPFTAYPDWWLMELPSPRHSWFRCHLLGPRLGGPGGVAWHNLIPVRFGAKRGMQSSERMVELFIKEYLEYKVDLVYQGRNRWPEKIIISAKNGLYDEIHNVD